jgi:hypothetical protein
MQQADAMRVLDEFKTAIRCPAGYDRAPKHQFFHLLNQLDLYFSNHQTFDAGRMLEVRAITDDVQRQRIDATGGAAGIEEIIRRVEVLVRHLPETIPPRPVFTLPPDTHADLLRAYQAHAYAKLP